MISSTPEVMYVNEIITLRPTESKERAERQRPQDVSDRERDQEERRLLGLDVEELLSTSVYVKEHGVVEERLSTMSDNPSTPRDG